ncbi:MAG: carboxypeptidase-like regulatory domain-containing protein, partial [Planctomycetota bacterium]
MRAELWKEEDSRVRLMDSGRTARDGTCLLDPVNGASKLVLRKEGYASEEFGTGGEQLLFLFPERPLIGRVLDFQGRPVVGARLATRQSCKHAPHAATAQTDARGQFRMFDFPNGPNGASIEITAPGFVAESLEDESRWWTEIEVTGEVLFFLARQPPLRARLLDANGENCVGVTFENYERPLLFAVTNGSGELHFPSWQGARRLHCTPADGTHYKFPGVPLPVGLPVTLLPGVPPTPVAGNACLVTVEPTLHGAFYSGITFEELDDPLPNVTIFTHSGETYTGVGPHFLDSAGVEATVVAGHPFSGWRESVQDISLEPPAISPKIRIERETE